MQILKRYNIWICIIDGREKKTWLQQPDNQHFEQYKLPVTIGERDCGTSVPAVHVHNMHKS